LVDKRKELKNLARHTSIYGVTEIFARFIGFMMIPFYTHYLSPADYGISELVAITEEIINLVMGMGISNAIYRFYYDRSESADSRTVMSTAIIGVSITCFFGMLLLYLFSSKISLLALGSEEYTLYINLSIGSLWFGQIINIVYTYIRVTESSRLYAILSLSRLFFALSLNIFLIAVLQWGVLGLFASNLISAALFSVFTLPFVIRKVGVAFSLELGKKMLRYSLPMVPTSVASLSVNIADRFFVRAFLSLADAGIFSLGHRLGSICFYLVRVPFMQIWDPRRYALYSEGAPPEFFARVTTYFFGLILFVGLGISLFVQDIIKIISPMNYWNAAIYVPAIVVCWIIYALADHVAFGILVSKKTEYWTYVNLLMGAMNLLLNYIFISRFGVWGAILARFIPIVFQIVFLYVIGNWFFKIPFEWARMASLFVITAFLFFISLFIHPSSTPLALAYDCFMTLLFLPLVWIAGLPHEDEKLEFKKLYRRILRRQAAEII